MTDEIFPPMATNHPRLWALKRYFDYRLGRWSSWKSEMGAKQFAWDLSTDDKVCYTLQLEFREPASLLILPEQVVELNADDLRKFMEESLSDLIHRALNGQSILPKDVESRKFYQNKQTGK